MRMFSWPSVSACCLSDRPSGAAAAPITAAHWEGAAKTTILDCGVPASRRPANKRASCHFQLSPGRPRVRGLFDRTISVWRSGQRVWLLVRASRVQSAEGVRSLSWADTSRLLA
jgi:hypothetical protein